MLLVLLAGCAFDTAPEALVPGTVSPRAAPQPQLPASTPASRSLADLAGPGPAAGRVVLAEHPRGDAGPPEPAGDVADAAPEDAGPVPYNAVPHPGVYFLCQGPCVHDPDNEFDYCPMPSDTLVQPRPAGGCFADVECGGLVSGWVCRIGADRRGECVQHCRGVVGAAP